MVTGKWNRSSGRYFANSYANYDIYHDETNLAFGLTNYTDRADSVRAVAQTHGTQSLASDLLDVVNCFNQMGYECLRVFGRWEVSQAGHSLVFGSWYLIGSLLRHLGRVRPVVLAGEHVHRAAVGVDGGNARATVPAAEVEVKVAVEDLEN